jgi:flagellar motor switch protein FliM
VADTLSQKDIDSLLEGTAPVIDVPKATTEVLAFDFRHPPRIARDRRANLEAIFGRFAVSVQAYLTSRLRATTDVILSSVEQATFAEFIFSLASPCGAVVFDLNRGGPYQGVLDLGTDLGFHLIDRLFGGPGEELNLKRSMTLLEQTVLKGVADRLFGLFSEAWKDDISFDPQYVAFESRPDELAIIGRDENVVVANIEVRSGAFSGLIALCLPLHALEGFLQEKPQRATRAQFVPDTERNESRVFIEANLQRARVEVVARFPMIQLRARDIAQLQPGRVIHTGHHLEVPIEVYVNGRRRFLGALGQVHRNLGLRINQTANERGNGRSSVPRGKVL